MTLRNSVSVMPRRGAAWTIPALCAGMVMFATACGREPGARRAPTTSRGAQRPNTAVSKIALVAAEPGATSRDQLSRTIETMQARLSANAADSRAAVTLADALLRQARVTGNAGLASRAEAALDAVLAAAPNDYAALRERAAVYLSAHRFRDALRAAERARDIQPLDAWNYGAIGDAHLELGEYDQAFAAFDRMATLKPNAAAYARVSYARELQGDLDAALRYMTMAAEATSPQDAESIAWHFAHIAHLELQRGHTAAAEHAYARADFAFPRHPMAIDGMARLCLQRGDNVGALALLEPQLANEATPALMALAADAHLALGHRDQAERLYRLAEAAWESDTPEPARLARFLADRGRRTGDAVRIAEQAARERQDIFTMDALAWAYFKDGRVADARRTLPQALRTGSRDLDIRRHATAIKGKVHHP